LPTDSLLAVFAFSVVVSFGAVVSPGPVSATVITEAPRQGWRVGPLISSGHSIMELLVTILIGLGLSAGLAGSGLQNIIAVAGGLVLIYIGVSYLYAVLRGGMRLPEMDEEAPVRSKGTLLGLGAITTASNPFWYAWWVTVAPGYLSQAQALGIGALVAFFLGHISTDFAWNTFLAGATSAGRRLLSDRLYQGLIIITGGFMLYIGVVFIQSAFSA
jgi:threonine/homoserine/homoserine lactone efflux protein